MYRYDWYFLYYVHFCSAWLTGRRGDFLQSQEHHKNGESFQTLRQQVRLSLPVYTYLPYQVRAFDSSCHPAVWLRHHLTTTTNDFVQYQRIRLCGTCFAEKESVRTTWDFFSTEKESPEAQLRKRYVANTYKKKREREKSSSVWNRPHLGETYALYLAHFVVLPCLTRIIHCYFTIERAARAWGPGPNWRCARASRRLLHRCLSPIDSSRVLNFSFNDNTILDIIRSLFFV